jgi:hypothetical protein
MLSPVPAAAVVAWFTMRTKPVAGSVSTTAGWPGAEPGRVSTVSEPTSKLASAATVSAEISGWNENGELSQAQLSPYCRWSKNVSSATRCPVTTLMPAPATAAASAS